MTQTTMPENNLNLKTELGRNGRVLIRFYQQKISALTTLFSTYEPEKKSTSQLRSEVDTILDELAAANKEYVAIAVPDDYTAGINEANRLLEALGITLASYNAAVHESIVTSIGRTMEIDFAKNIEALRNGVISAISEAEKIRLREAFIQTEKVRKQVIRETKQVLIDQGISSLFDRGGKTWSLDTYAEMLVRTKQREALNSGLVNRSMENGIILFRVTFTGTKHKACAYWEGKLVTVNGEFGLPTIAEATAKGLFHPNCYHRLLPEPLEQKKLEHKQ